MSPTAAPPHTHTQLPLWIITGIGKYKRNSLQLSFINIRALQGFIAVLRRTGMEEWS